MDWQSNCLLLAYIDPGTGALVLQMIMASLVMIGIKFRRAIAGFIRFLTGRWKKKQNEHDETRK